MEVFYTVVRVQESGNDFLRVTGTEQEFDEKGILDIEFNDVPISSLSAAGNYVKQVKEAIEQVIANRQTLKQEKKLVSIYNRLSDNINNESLSGAIDQDVVDVLKAKVY